MDPPAFQNVNLKTNSPYAVTKTSEMPERINAVLAVLDLIFNEGYAATGNGSFLRADLCAEAIRLCRLFTRVDG